MNHILTDNWRGRCEVAGRLNCLHATENFPAKGSVQVSTSRSPKFSLEVSKTAEETGRLVVEIFQSCLPKCRTHTSGRMPDDFRWSIDKTLNHPESHSEKVIFLSVSSHPLSPPPLGVRFTELD